MSTVYLIHFERPIGNEKHQASHYLGFTSRSLKSRLAEHKAGNGSAIMAAVARLGIPWTVVKTWPDGTRKLERQLKNQKHAWRHCPVCRESRRSKEIIA